MAKQESDCPGVHVFGCYLVSALEGKFPSEDATRFDLVEELHTMPAKVPVNMHQIVTWLEDYVTKLTAADEAGAHVEPRCAMSILTHVREPPQAQNSLFVTEWVAIFREGLRDDVTARRLQDACPASSR